MGWLRWAHDRWRGYRRLTRGERRLAVGASLVLPFTVLAQGFLGFKRCQSLLAAIAAVLRTTAPVNRHGAGGEFSPAPVEDVAARTAAVVRAVVQRHPFRSNCLQRSLTLWCLLRARGIEGDLRVGVQKIAGRLEAHAWVEYRGAVLNDQDDVRRRFLPFARALVPQPGFVS